VRITITKMAQTSYRIQHNGHEWSTKDAEAAQHYAEQGATVKAVTLNESDISGIPVKRLGLDQLEELSRLAEAEGWNHVQTMTRDYYKE